MAPDGPACVWCAQGTFKAEPGPGPCTQCSVSWTTTLHRGASSERECVACQANTSFDGIDAATGSARCTPCRKPCFQQPELHHTDTRCKRVPLGNGTLECSDEWGFDRIDKALVDLARAETWTSYSNFGVLRNLVFRDERSEEDPEYRRDIFVRARDNTGPVEALDATVQDVYMEDTRVWIRGDSPEDCRMDQHWEAFASYEKTCAEITQNKARTTHLYGACNVKATASSLFAYLLPVHDSFNTREAETNYPDICTVLRVKGKGSTDILTVDVAHNATRHALAHYDLRRYVFREYTKALRDTLTDACHAINITDELLDNIFNTKYITTSSYSKTHDTRFCNTGGIRPENDDDSGTVTFDIAHTCNDQTEPRSLLRLLHAAVACDQGHVLARFAALARDLDANITALAPAPAPGFDIAMPAGGACAGHPGNRTLHASLYHDDTSVARVHLTATSSDGLCTVAWNGTVPATTRPRAVPRPPSGQSLTLQHAADFDAVYRLFRSLELARGA